MAERMFGEFRKMAKERTYKELTHVRETEGMHSAARKFLEKMHVEINFLREQDPTLKQDRERLNSESGLIISLHPSGVFDLLPALLALDRTDLKIVADNKGGNNAADQFSELFGEGAMIPINVAQKSTLVAGVETAKDHIRNGGVVFLFPSSDLDRSGEHHGFRNRIFGDMVRNLRPEEMVYAFRPDEEQSYAARKRYRDPKQYLMNTRTMPIDVDERYTTAAGWKEVIKQAGKQKPLIEDGLRSYYDHLFEPGS